MRYKQLIIIFLIITLTNCNNHNKKSEDNTSINPKIKPYVEFLQNHNQSAKDYILSLFDKYDYVILSERSHYEYSQYKTILDIISDKDFINGVGNIFVEVGVSTEQKNVNEFLNSESLSEQEIKNKALKIYRNIPFLASWDKTSYYDFLVSLYQINQELTNKRKINLYYSDIPFSWKKTITSEQYKMFMDTINTRDSIMASQIIEGIENMKKQNIKRKRALIILNYRHGFTNLSYSKNGEKADNTGRYLKEKYKNKIASVLINDLFNKNNIFYPYQNGKWDAAFEILKIENVGFNFKNSPFGKDNFDMYPVKNNLKYEDVFTGFIYTSPIDSFIFKKGVKDYISDDFKNEYYRRMKIAGYEPDITNDTLQRVWQYSEKEWCPNYDSVKKEINKWKNTL
ncbi:MAG: hypothetical protein DRJ01_16760 [Bacteroidetes bacterium]|nr:MAG: hypothetical protein DRJ01_16760 [Bacteroidota bacterium]